MSIQLPVIPGINLLPRVPYISASECERLLICPLRVALDREPILKDLQPFASSAMLGTAAHTALASMIRAHECAVEPEIDALTREVAIRTFDAALLRVCSHRDARIAARGALPSDSAEPPAALPFYAITRARFARFTRERFGDRWSWPIPKPTGHYRSNPVDDYKPFKIVEVEIELRSNDGLIHGTADAIDRSKQEVVIEEFKTGEATAERLLSWKLQLLIYGKLYQDQYGHAPTILRVRSLATGNHDFPYSAAEATAAFDATRTALDELNNRIASGARPEGLARPSEVACKGCPHRPWCDSYWSTITRWLDGDVEGTIVRSNGWEVELRLPDGTVVTVDLKALNITAETRAKIRVCGARVISAERLTCTRGTSVWRLPP